MRKPAISGLIALSLSVGAIPGWGGGDGQRLLADESPAAAESTASEVTFEAILREQTLQSFRAVARYVQNHPDAADSEKAYRWLFETARDANLQREAMKIADRYLERDSETLSSQSLALQIRSVGLARAGRLDDALSDFDAHLRTASIRNPNDSLDLALALATEAQFAGERQSAQHVYTRLSSVFFLNPYVRRLCETRIAKLELGGRAAPEVTAQTLAGEDVDLSELKGKVVLIDFWATNCPPCLEEFPAMKEMYQELHRQGLEVVGITLDEEQEVVERFQEKMQLPWPLVMSGDDDDATRNRYRVVTIPSLFLIDRKGEIAYVDVRGNDLKRAVRKLLEQ